MTRRIPEREKSQTTSAMYISFDLDDTLFDNGPVIRQAFRALYNYLCDNYSGFDTTFSFHTFLQFAHESRQAHPEIIDFNVLRKIHIKEALAKAGYQEHATESAYQVFLQARQQVELFPESRPMLEEVAKDHQLVSISNGNAQPEHIGLGDIFSASFNPTSIGYAKPNPKMYLAVCDELAISPAQMLHIGDCLDNDYRAAIQAGCKAIWFNTQGSQAVKVPQVQCLSELPAKIANLVAS